MDTQHLIELRESIRASVRSLEDTAKAQALSTNQAKALEKYRAQVADLDAQIEEARARDDQAIEKRNAAAAAMGAQPMTAEVVHRGILSGLTLPGRNSIAPQSDLRSYGIGDNLHQVFQPSEAPSLAAVVRGMALGDWSHMTAEQRGLISTGAAAAIPGASVLSIEQQAMQQSVVFQAGARGVNIERPSEKVARVVSTGTPEWLPDAANRELTDQTITITPEDLTAYSAWLYTKCSIESLEDATGLDEAITTAFSRQLALLYDQAALAGTGSDMPKGVGYMSNAVDGICEQTSVGLLEDHTPFIQAAGSVLGAHHKPTSVMIDPDTWTTLAMMSDTTGQPIQPPKAYTDMTEYVSDLLVSGDAIVADWSKWLFGTRTGMTLEVSRTGAGFKTGFVEIRAYVRFGGITVDPAAFCRLSGIETSAVS